MKLDPTTLEALKLGWYVLLTVSSVAGTALMWWASRYFVRRDEYAKSAAETQGSVEEHANRLTAIETELRQAPKHADLVQIASQLSELRAQIAEFKGQSTQTNHLLAAIHEHLLNSD